MATKSATVFSQLNVLCAIIERRHEQIHQFEAQMIIESLSYPGQLKQNVNPKKGGQAYQCTIKEGGKGGPRGCLGGYVNGP